MKKIENNLDLIGILTIGFIGYLWVIGMYPLNPYNTNWLRGIDSLQHYLGWDFFRFSSWSFPIGLNPYYGLEISSSIVYSDSIPLLAIFFKLFNAWLPNTFQYFGIWLLTCFLLQAYFAWCLMGLSTKDRWLRYLGVSFFVFAPPLIWRMTGVNAVAGIGEHSALSSHFLILAALYFIFNKRTRYPYIAWISLLIITLLIHFYLFVMVFGLFIADLCDRFLVHKGLKIKYAVITVFSSIGLILFFAWQAGYFAISSSTLPELGYGFYRTSVFSLFDSFGWSSVLPALPQSEEKHAQYGINLSQGTYDGFAYLGLGILLLIAFSLWLLIKGKSIVLISLLRTHAWFLLCLFIFFVFAVSNNISIFNHNYYVQLPAFILELSGNLRNSGRFIWPLFYTIIFVALSLIVRSPNKLFATVFLGTCLFLQVWDIKPLINLGQKKLWSDSQWIYQSPLKNEFWSVASKKYKNIIQQPLLDSQWQPNWETFSTFAAFNRMGTNAVYLARFDPQKIEAANKSLLKLMEAGNFDPMSLYVLGPWKNQPNRKIYFDPNLDLLAQIDGFMVLAPGWRQCHICPVIKTNLIMGSLAPPVLIDEPIRFTRSTNAAQLFLLDSWGFEEDWGVWTVGESASIVLPIPNNATKLNLEINAFISHLHRTQEIEILSNYQALQKISLIKPYGNKIQIMLDKKTIANSYIQIQLKLLNPISPKSLGMSNDDRRLGVGLVSAKFH